MAVAEATSKVTGAGIARGFGAFGLAVVFAGSGSAAWYLAETLFGRVGFWQPFIGVLSVGIGGLAGYGAFLGSQRQRGPQTQAAAVVATLVVLPVAQALITRLIFVRELETQGLHGARFDLSLGQWWEYVSWALFSTSPPSILFWAMAVAYAISVPRRYKYEADRR